jgi:hypothetical protein
MSEKITVSQHQLQFNNYLVEFIQKMREIIPKDHAYQRQLSKYYKYYRNFVDQNKRVDFIQEFVQYLSKYNKEISISDECLFSEEPEYYPGKSIQILKGLDFKVIFKLETLNEKTREGIWKYLQTLYVIGTYVLKESKRSTDLLKKQQTIIASIIESLKMEQKIKDDADRLEEEERRKAEESGFNFAGLQDIFGENNIITEMAMEIAKELNLPNEKLTDPLEAIKLLFGQDGQRLQEIIAKVGHKLAEKIQRGGITEEQLVGEAKKMNEKLLGKFKSIPGMPDLEKFSQKVADHISKEMEEKKQQAAASGQAPPPPTMEELTKSLSQLSSELGPEHMDQFRTNFSEMMSGFTQGGASSSSNDIPKDNPISFETKIDIDDELSVTVESENTIEQNEELDDELAELKKNIDN